MKNIIGTKTKNIKDYTIEDYNAEYTVETRIRTRTEKDIIYITRKNTSPQNILPKTIRLFINNIVDNLRIRLKKKLYQRIIIFFLLNTKVLRIFLIISLN
jgi:hypothetical protein